MCGIWGLGTLLVLIFFRFFAYTPGFTNKEDITLALAVALAWPLAMVFLVVVLFASIIVNLLIRVACFTFRLKLAKELE
jgi:Mg2+/Co2+ transporter CorB